MLRACKTTLGTGPPDVLEKSTMTKTTPDTLGEEQIIPPQPHKTISLYLRGDLPRKRTHKGKVPGPIQSTWNFSVSHFVADLILQQAVLQVDSLVAQ